MQWRARSRPGMGSLDEGDDESSDELLRFLENVPGGHSCPPGPGKVASRFKEAFAGT